MMVMPLGPDFAKSLGIPASEIGIIGGAYTFSAAIFGLIAGLFLDEIPRKKAVIICLSGLAIATIGGALVWSKGSMIAVRLFAGAFGGPLSAVSLALVADHIPPERRGAAIGKVSGAFAMASVLGVPFGLEIAQLFSWHYTFIITGILCLMIIALTVFKLPTNKVLRKNESFKTMLTALINIIRSPLPRAGYLYMGLSMMAGFMIIPNIAAHLQLNLGYPRERLGLLYFLGGTISFFGMRFSGMMVDRTSATLTSCIFTTTLITVLLSGFVFYPNFIPVELIFVLFMFSMSGRNVAGQTLSSEIPEPKVRGAYMSVQSAVMHFSSSFGAYLSSVILIEKNGKLENVKTLGLIAVTLCLLVPFIVYYVEKKLEGRQKY